MLLKIFIDGACKNNGQDNAQAGWGIVVYDDQNRIIHQDSGKVQGKQTNNRAELTALLEAVKVIRNQKPEKAGIVSDSSILVDGVTGKAKRKANRDIWEQIEAIFVELRGVVDIHVMHVDREENKEADELASQAANSLI